MHVPFGALPGFLLRAEIREVASHYGVRERMLWRADTRSVSESVTEARHALMWKLTHKRRVSPARVAAWLHCTPRAVRYGANEHARRIKLFQETARKAAL